MSCDQLNCVINFGVVPIGNSLTKVYTIKNQHHDLVIYYLKRNDNTNPIYQVFDLNKYEIRLQPEEEYNLKIKYTPNIPGSIDCDYFSLRTINNYCQLRLRGECIGPSVNSSVRYLNFFKLPTYKNIKQVFELTNNSTVSATYQFDYVEEQFGIFKVEPTKGILAPNSYEYITVKFQPQTPGAYSRQLWCLILHHEPILLNLYGIFSKFGLNHELPLRCYPLPYEETIGFPGYFSDSVTIKRVAPPISLSVNWLDFGRLLPESFCQTLTTSFTNHLPNPVKVEWENVDMFRVNPEQLEIPPKQSILYECYFQPSDICRLGGTIVQGHVSWVNSEIDSEALNVPIPITLRLIGHSFPKNQGWIPSVSIIPNNIILPLTVPNFSSWTTFIIKTQGPLPILYKLVPPVKTNFIMKPMVGLIRDFQIISVLLESNSSEPKSYIEQWSIELNGQLQNSTPIYVKAQTDLPCVIVAENNCLQFDPIHPGTQTSRYVSLRNVSYCQLQYKFQLQEQIEIEPITGILAPNEEIFVNALYQSKLEQHGIKKHEIICEVQSFFNGALIAESIDIPVTVIVEVIHTELCALPQSIEKGEVESGSIIETSFYIYNFGKAAINFKLFHDYGHDLKDIVITPIFGTCGPREKLLVKLQMKVRQIGRNTLFISYSNRLNSFSYLETNGPVKCIFKIDYICILPTIQIVDLFEHNYPIFNTGDLWQLLKIDEINCAFLEANPGEIKRVELSVPESEIIEKLFYLNFVVQNITNIDLDVNLKRQQMCDCKPKESTESFTFRAKIFDCPHKEILTIELGSSTVLALLSQTLRFKVKYIFPGEQILAYKFELSQERTIILTISVTGIPNESYILSVCDKNLTLNMGFVYIGLRDPPVFAYWLYNNTEKPLPFKLDDLEIIKLCNSEGFTVLKCLNCVGFVNGKSSAPILFKFWPIEVKIYKVSIPLFLGSKETLLTIQGCGSDEKNRIDYINFMNLEQKTLKNNVVSLSVDKLIIEPILVTNFTERLFFIQNRSKTQQIKYTWKPCFIDGLVKIETLNVSEILKPKESHPVVIKIQSLNEPCSVRVLLTVEFVDVDQADSYYTTINKETQESEPDLVMEPEYFVIALPIFVNVIGILDRDNCLTAESQLTQKPWEKLHLDADKFVEEYFEKFKVQEQPIHLKPQVTQTEIPRNDLTIIDKEMTEIILEQIIGDVVFSDYFNEILKTLKTEPSPVYSQIKFNKASREKDRKIETKKFLTRPNAVEVVEICENVVLDSVQAVFRLGPIEKNNKENQ